MALQFDLEDYAMKKKYIILTSSIGGMGGAEMYTRNKILYLKNLGWETDVFYFLPQDIILKELKEYEGNCLPDLQYGFYYISRRQRENMIETLCRNLNTMEFIVVESLMLNLTFWGEMIAIKTGAKHIINCMEEQIRPLSDKEISFFEYKLKRREILNGNKQSFPRYFGNKIKADYIQYSNTISPFCSNVTSDDPSISFPCLSEANFNILSLGRLNKPYIQNMIKELIIFCRKYDNYKFNIVFIGNAPDRTTEKEIGRILSTVQNIQLYMCGYMYPISEQFITQMDVAIASSNSILVTADLGIQTIAIDANDYYAIGVYGYTTKHKLFRSEEPKQSIAVLLEEILIQKKYKRNSFSYKKENHTQLETAFKPQIEYILNSPYDRAAYNITSIYSKKQYVIGNIKRIMNTILGRWK